MSMYTLGIGMGAASKSFSEGIKDVENMQDIAFKDQARGIAAKQEERTAIKFGNEQEDRSNRLSAIVAEANALSGPTEGTAAGVPAQPDMSGRMNLGGPKSDGTGVSYDVGEGETVRAGVTTERTTKTRAAPAPQARGGNVTGLPQMGLTVDQAKQIYRQKPNPYTREIFLEAQKREIDRLEFQAKRYDQSFINDLNAANAAARRAETERTKVLTESARIARDNDQLEADRRVLAARSEMAGAQVQNLEPGRSLLDPMNAGKAEPIIANVVAGMNVAQKSMGFTTDYKLVPGKGYSLTTTTKGKDGKDRLVSSQLVGTVDELKKLVAIGGVASNPENWAKINTAAIGAQRVSVLEDIANNNLKAESAAADLKRRLTEAQVAQAGPAAQQADEFYKKLDQPLSAILDDLPNLRREAEDLARKVPAMFMGERKTETEDPLGKKTKGTVPYNRLQEDIDRIIPPTTVKRFDKNGREQAVNLFAAAEEMATREWGEMVKGTREMFKLDKGVEPTKEQIARHVYSELITYGADPRLAEYLTAKKVIERRMEIEKLQVQRDVAPAGVALPAPAPAEGAARPGVGQAWKNLWAPIPPDSAAPAPAGRGVTVVPQGNPALLNRMQYQR